MQFTLSKKGFLRLKSNLHLKNIFLYRIQNGLKINTFLAENFELSEKEASSLNCKRRNLRKTSSYTNKSISLSRNSRLTI